jgi:hypothetical protein
MLGRPLECESGETRPLTIGGFSMETITWEGAATKLVAAGLDIGDGSAPPPMSDVDPLRTFVARTRSIVTWITLQQIP